MPATQTFRYEAISAEGRVVAGQIDAPDEPAAREELRRLALTPRRFESTVPPRVGALGATDFAAFNDQLAHLARAGLPVEQGLRLVAQDLSRGRLKSAVDAVSADLAAGVDLPAAIDRHRRAFPPLYASVVDAGIRAGNLPAVLFNVGRHLELSRRLRAALTRALAYPVALLLSLVLVSAFLSAYVLPLMSSFYVKPDGTVREPFAFNWSRGAPQPPPTVPWVTIVMLQFGRVAPALAAIVVVTIVLWIILGPIVRGTSLGARLRDDVLARLPLVGPAVRFDLVGRWCDATRIGVEAGLDLPAAIALANDAIGSRRLTQDGRAIAAALSAGGTIAQAGPFGLMPPTVPATLDLASRSRQLPHALATLSDLYARQADARARSIPLVLTPILLVIIAGVLGMMLASIFLPLVRMLNVLS